MERLPVLVALLLLLSVSIFCSSAGEKGRGFHVGQREGEPSRSESSQRGSEPCPCPGSQRPLKQKKHGHMCPCDSFIKPQSGRHRRHSHGKNKHPSHHRKQKCQMFLRQCQHRHLMTGLQIPL